MSPNTLMIMMLRAFGISGHSTTYDVDNAASAIFTYQNSKYRITVDKLPNLHRG